jgi:hypothetical protein
VEKIYLSGIYRDKYNYMSRSESASGMKTPMKTPLKTMTIPVTPYKGTMTEGEANGNGNSRMLGSGKKTRSAYPLVRLK